MNVKVYHLENCSTCKKAAAWLTKHGISATFLSIKKEVPSILELQRAYQRYKNWRRLFNTSGKEYRAHNLSVKLQQLSEQEILHLLRGNGMLIRRPFLVTDSDVAVGFIESEWKELLLHAQ